MTALKQEAISIIEKMPDDKMVFLIQILQGAANMAQTEGEERERRKAEKRAEAFRQGVRDIQALLGNENGWDSEEAMLRELSEERRERAQA